MMDNFAKVFEENQSRCIECDRFRWCPYKVWVGEPKNCLDDLQPKPQENENYNEQT